jgi:hypothetical protein
VFEPLLRDGARPEAVQDSLGHANIYVTQNALRKNWWEELSFPR